MISFETCVLWLIAGFVLGAICAMQAVRYAWHKRADLREECYRIFWKKDFSRMLYIASHVLKARDMGIGLRLGDEYDESPYGDN